MRYGTFVLLDHCDLEDEKKCARAMNREEGKSTKSKTHNRQPTKHSKTTAKTNRATVPQQPGSSRLPCHREYSPQLARSSPKASHFLRSGFVICYIASRCGDSSGISCPFYAVNVCAATRTPSMVNNNIIKMLTSLRHLWTCLYRTRMYHNAHHNDPKNKVLSKGKNIMRTNGVRYPNRSRMVKRSFLAPRVLEEAVRSQIVLLLRCTIQHRIYSTSL
jgi:hypothetical protein